MKTRSRLSRRAEEKTKKHIAITISAAVLIFFLLFKFGIPFLVNVSLFVSGVKNSSDASSKNNSLTFISPPVLNPLPTATNSASIIVSGIAQADLVNLYVNGELTDKQDVREGSSFSFDDVLIKKGENTIQVKAATKEGKSSDFSNQLTIAYKDNSPTLTIDTPSDGQSFSKDQNPIQVTGKTDSGTKITINNLWAIVEQNGNFSYTLTLQNGENKIKITATDDAGNKTETERKTTYNP